MRDEKRRGDAAKGKEILRERLVLSPFKGDITVA